MVSTPGTEQDTSAAPRSKQVVRAARRTTHWQRRALVNLVPFACLAGVQGTAMLVAAAELALWWRIAAVVTVVAVVLIWMERSGGSPFGIAIVGGLTYLVPAYLWGVFGGMALVAGCVMPLLAAPFWREHQTRYRHRPDPAATPPPRPEPEQPALEALSPEQVKYAERVVPNNAVFTGTHLDKPVAVPGGFTARIIGEPGKTELSKLQTGAGTVASAWEGRVDQVTIEETPDGNSSQAQVTVISRGDNLLQKRYLEDDGTAIDVRTGIARVAYFNDLRPAHWSWWTVTGGAQMGLNCGTTGTGKSKFGGTKMCLAHQCPVIAVVLLDAQDGSSQPSWNGKTHRYGEGIEQSYAELQAVDYVAGRRAHYISHVHWVDEQGRERIGKPYLLPGDPDLGGMVLIYVVVEEAPLLFQDETYGPKAIKLLAPGSKTYRKPGISLDIYTQNLDLGELGRNRAFRANIAAGGSVAAFRTGASTDHKMVGLANDPSKLPEYFPNGEKTHGLGYLRGLDRRQATMRPLIPRDEFAIASRPAAGAFDQATLGFYEEYFHGRARGRRPAVPQDTPQQTTSGDVQAAIEEVLAAAAGPLDMGSIVAACSRRIQGCSLGEVKAALQALVAAERVWRKGPDYVHAGQGR
ncbi:hypothetical protein ACWEN6_14065 [Sphaerisporangium sp. NPDC004334]